jgi:hypothetical protein
LYFSFFLWFRWCHFTKLLNNDNQLIIYDIIWWRIRRVKGEGRRVKGEGRREKGEKGGKGEEEKGERVEKGGNDVVVPQQVRETTCCLAYLAIKFENSI